MSQNPFLTDAMPLVVTEDAAKVTLGNKSNDKADDTEYYD